MSCPWSQGLSHAIGNRDEGEDGGQDMGQPLRGQGMGMQTGGCGICTSFTWTTGKTISTVQSEGNSFFCSDLLSQYLAAPGVSPALPRLRTGLSCASTAQLLRAPRATEPCSGCLFWGCTTPGAGQGPEEALRPGMLLQKQPRTSPNHSIEILNLTTSS